MKPTFRPIRNGRLRANRGLMARVLRPGRREIVRTPTERRPAIPRLDTPVRRPELRTANGVPLTDRRPTERIETPARRVVPVRVVTRREEFVLIPFRRIVGPVRVIGLRDVIPARRIVELERLTIRGLVLVERRADGPSVTPGRNPAGRFERIDEGFEGRTRNVGRVVPGDRELNLELDPPVERRNDDDPDDRKLDVPDGLLKEERPEEGLRPEFPRPR